MKPDIKNQPSRHKTPSSTINKTIDKKFKSKSKLCTESIKKVSIDELSIQGNFNGMSECENSNDLFIIDGKNSSFSNNNSIIEIKTTDDENEDEDEEVREIFNDIPKVKIMARKSTSPMKLPSNLKIGGNGTSNNSKRSKTKCSSRIKGNTNAPNNSEINTTNIASIDNISTDTVLNFFRTSEKISLDCDIKTRNLLLRDFKKPAIIYSYLGLRHRYHPIFLNRNLKDSEDLPKVKKVTKKEESNLENILKNIKSKINFKNQNTKTNKPIHVKKGSFTINFQSFQLNKKMIDAIKNEKNDDHINFSNHIEIYAIRNSKDISKNSSDNLLLTYNCSVDSQNLKSTMDLSSLQLTVENKKCSHILIKSSLIKSKESLDNSIQKPSTKKRKTNKQEIIETDLNTSIDNSLNVINEFFIICSVNWEDIQSETENQFLNEMAKSSFIDLNLKTNLSYCLKMKEIGTSEKKTLAKYSYLNRSGYNEGFNGNRSSKTPNKSQFQLTQNKNFENISDQSIKDLLNQFYNNGPLLNFSTEINCINVISPITSPFGKNSNSLHQTASFYSNNKNTPSIQKISISMLNPPEQKQNEFQTVNSQLTKKKKSNLSISNESNLQIVKPLTKSADQLIHYNFICTSLKTNPQKNSKSGSNSQIKLSSISRNFACPFCYKNCIDFDFLFQHLQTNHFRFIVCEQKFTDSTESGQNSITSSSKLKKLQFDILCDEIFDGSYLGNPYDIHNSLHLGFSACRKMPTKRVPVTYILTNKKSSFVKLNKFKNLTQDEITAIHLIQQQQQQLSLPMQSNNLYNVQAGMERLYYHTTTTLPIQVNEIDIDSDNELDPDWLKDYTTLLINEFADVNEGEKGIMRLWNLHLLHNNFVGDLQVYKACKAFLTDQATSLFKLNLFNNFQLHLANLHDYGLLSPKEILTLIEYMNEMKTKCEEGEKKFVPTSSKKNKSFKSPITALAKFF